MEKGERLNPPSVGYVASAGHAEIPVVRNQNIGIIATGDEVVAPRKPLGEGGLHASNLVTLASWCGKYGFEVDTQVLPDEKSALEEGLSEALKVHDAILTSGGAWKGERDLVVEVLKGLGSPALCPMTNMMGLHPCGKYGEKRGITSFTSSWIMLPGSGRCRCPLRLRRHREDTENGTRAFVSALEAIPPPAYGCTLSESLIYLLSHGHKTQTIIVTDLVVKSNNSIILSLLLSFVLFPWSRI